MKSKIVRLAVVLALVVSLFAVSAPPVAAAVEADIDVDAITGGVQSVLATPNTAGDVARYVVGFSQSAASAALAEDIGTITLTFPSGTVVPASLPAAAISVNGVTLTTVGAGTAPAPPTVVGRTVTITVAAVIAAGDTAITVIFSQAAGITNPSLGTNTARVAASTSDPANVVPVNLVAYAITPAISVSPTSGARGASVAVTGRGFTPNTSVDIARAGTNFASTTAASDGTISTTVTIPSAGAAAAPGAAAVTGTDGAGLVSAAATFTVTPSLTLTPASGQPGTTVQLTGSAWPAASQVGAASVGGVSVLGTVRGPARTLAAGATPGTLATAGAAANLTDGEADFIVTSAVAVGDLVVNTTDGSIGVVTAVAATVLTIAGGLAGGVENDWDVGEAYVVLAGNQTTGTGSIVSVAGGATANTTIQVPQAATPGAKTVSVTIGGTAATATFEVVARSITLSPASGNVGTRVNMNGTGLTPGGAIALDSITIGAVATTHAAIVIATDGSWNAVSVVVAPATPTGAQPVVATDGVRTAQGTFTLQSRAITLSPSSVVAGGQIVVTGTGFLRNGTVNIQQPAGTNRATATADAAGNFAAAVSTTWLGAGAATQTITVTAVDSVTATIVATATFTIPGAAITVTPTTGGVGTTVTIAGTNFAPYTVLTAATIGAAAVLPGAGIVTDANGAFSFTATVPGTVAVGGTTVTVTQGAVVEIASLTVTAAPTTVATQLASIAGQYTVVWGFNAATQTWQFSDPAQAGISDLASLTRGAGYWINASAATTLVSGANSYSLSAGWNLIGWLG